MFFQSLWENPKEARIKRLARNVGEQSFALGETESFLDSLSPRYREIVASAREKFSQELSDELALSLDRYNGHFYGAPGLRKIIALQIRTKAGSALIISGAYGAVTPSEPISQLLEPLPALPPKQLLPSYRVGIRV